MTNNITTEILKSKAYFELLKQVVSVFNTAQI